MDILSDPQASRVGLPDASEVIGSGGSGGFRIIETLPFDNRVIFSGDYLVDTNGFSVSDSDSFVIGLPSIIVNRLV